MISDLLNLASVPSLDPSTHSTKQQHKPDFHTLAEQNKRVRFLRLLLLLLV